MPKNNPIIITPAESDLARPHPEWLAILRSSGGDLWPVIEALAARVAALEGHT